MENTICLSRVHVPDELTVLERCSRRHHAVDPLRIEERLVDVWRLVVELTVHIEVVASLQCDRTNTSNLFGADSASQRDLASHRSTADNWLVQVEFLDHGRNARDIRVLGIDVSSGPVSALPLSKPATPGKRWRNNSPHKENSSHAPANQTQPFYTSSSSSHHSAPHDTAYYHSPRCWIQPSLPVRG